MFIKSLLLDSPKLSITIGRLVTGILPLWRSLAAGHSWASTGGHEGEWGQHGHTGRRGRTKWGQAGLGVSHETREALPPPPPRASCHGPHPTFISFLQRAVILGHFHDVDAVRVRLCGFMLTITVLVPSNFVFF